MLKEKGQVMRSQMEIDELIENEYQKYREGQAKALMGSGSKKADTNLKENARLNGVPPAVTFERIKEMNKGEQNYRKLLEMLGCHSYEQALIKVDRVNRADKFLQNIKQMVQKVSPSEEPNLLVSWRIIKEAVQVYSKHRMEE